MVSWVPQILLPPLFALAFFRRLPRGWVTAMAPVTYLGDIDYIVPGGHRVLTHTLLFPGTLLLLVCMMWRVAAPAVRGPLTAYALRPGFPLALTLSAYFLTAHDIMDIFTGGVTLFWPISSLNFAFDYEIFVNLRTHEVTPVTYASVEPEPAPLDPEYPWFTDEHNAMLAFVIVGLLVALAVRLARQWRTKRAMSDVT